MRRNFWDMPMWQPPHYNGYKVLAVILALLLWFYVTSVQNPMEEGVYTVPVELRNLDADLAMPETNYQVQVRVQGADNVIDALSSYHFSAYVDLTGMEAGEASPAIQVELPDGVSLVSLSPESIELTLENSVGRTSSLDVILQGSPAEHYSLLDPVLSPDLLTISGSAARMAEVGSVCVHADVSGISENYSKNLLVQVLDQEGNDITEFFTVIPEVVHVMIPVVYSQPETTVAVRPQTVNDPAPGFLLSRVVAEPASVRAFADLSLLNELYYLETEAIDVSGLRESTTFTVPLQVPEGVTLSQESVTVVVQIAEADSKKIETGYLQIENLAPALGCVAPNVTMEIEVSGEAELIRDLDQLDLEPYLDCSGILAPGSYVLPISVHLPSGISLVQVNPASVSVMVGTVGNNVE